MSLPLQLWSLGHVRQWLNKEGLNEFVPVFEKNHIDGLSLLQVTKHDLKDELEITKLHDRKRVWAAIERLLEEHGQGKDDTDESVTSSADQSVGYASSTSSWSSVQKPSNTTIQMSTTSVYVSNPVPEERPMTSGTRPGTQRDLRGSFPSSPTKSPGSSFGFRESPVVALRNSSQSPLSSPKYPSSPKSPMLSRPMSSNTQPASTPNRSPFSDYRSPDSLRRSQVQNAGSPSSSYGSSRPKLYSNGLPYPDIPVSQVVALNHPANEPTTQDYIDEMNKENDALTSLMHELEGVHVTEIKYSPVTSSPDQHPLGAHHVRGYVPNYAKAGAQPTPELNAALSTYNPRSRMLDGKVDYQSILGRQVLQHQLIDGMAERHEQVMQSAGFR